MSKFLHTSVQCGVLHGEVRIYFFGGVGLVLICIDHKTALNGVTDKGTLQHLYVFTSLSP